MASDVLSSKSGTMVDRRSTLALLAAGLLIPAREARAWARGAEVIDVTKAPYNASPDLMDNTGPFQSALNALMVLGGGTLLVPPGRYVFTNAAGLTYSGAALSVVGYGQEISILSIQHIGVALSVATGAVVQSVNIRDIGFSAPSGALGTAAVVLSFPSVSVSAWPSCVVENVDFGVSSSGAFKTCLHIINAWRSTVRGCGAHGSGGGNGSAFIVVDGFSIDNRIENCTCDQVDYGVFVASNIQGLHVSECALLAHVNSLSTGTTVYNSQTINVLGIFIHDCEFACDGTALNLYDVNGAFISDSHFGTSNPALPTVLVAGCKAVQFSNCQVSGQATPNVAAVGVAVAGSSGNATSGDTELNNITFQNISTGVMLIGAISTTARELRLFGYGFSVLVGKPTTQQGGSVVWSAVIDQSGNNTNELEWVGPDGSYAVHSTDRYNYTQPN